MTNNSCKTVFWTLALALTATSAFAQAQLKDDSEQTGQLRGPGQTDVWRFKLKEATPTIHIEVNCTTTDVTVYLDKQGATRITLVANNGKGRRVDTHGVAGFAISASPDRKKYPALGEGDYTVTVKAGKRSGTGSYTIRIPELKEPAPKPTTADSNTEEPTPPPKGDTNEPSPSPKGDELARLKKELKEVHARETKLLEQIEKLEAEIKTPTNSQALTPRSEEVKKP